MSTQREAHAGPGPIPNLTYFDTQDPNRFRFVYVFEGTTDSVQGCLALPKGIGPFRTVIVSHGPDGDAMKIGHNYAPLLMERGYAVIAIDLKYGDKPEESDWPEMYRRLNLVMDIIKGDERFDENNVFAFGNGYGAMVTLAYAAQTDKLKAVAASGSGRLPKNGVAFDKITAPVLLIHGANDESVPLDDAMKLKANLERAGKKVEIKVIEQQGHAVVILKSQNVFDAIAGFFNKQAK
jgi:dipeptidyl aminopeptidase/acylaminoacyl peptidase